jgi:hypothetical protein
MKADFWRGKQILHVFPLVDTAQRFYSFYYAGKSAGVTPARACSQ